MEIISLHPASPTRWSSLCGFPGKNTGVGCHFLPQEIFLTWRLNPGLLHCRQTLFFFFFNYLFFNWRMIALQNFVFVKRQHESAIAVHMPPPSWTSLPASSQSHPSRLIQSPCLSSCRQILYQLNHQRSLLNTHTSSFTFPTDISSLLHSNVISKFLPQFMMSWRVSFMPISCEWTNVLINILDPASGPAEYGSSTLYMNGLTYTVQHGRHQKGSPCKSLFH